MQQLEALERKYGCPVTICGSVNTIGEVKKKRQELWDPNRAPSDTNDLTKDTENTKVKDG